MVYAIEIQYKAVRDKSPLKNVMLITKVYKKIDEAKEEILSALRQLNSKLIPSSPRLERRTIQLAYAMSLPSYLKSNEEHIRIDDNALDLALKFFVEGAATRSQEKIDEQEISKRLGLFV